MSYLTFSGWKLVNRNNTERWKADIRASVDMYNAWFMEAAPEAYRSSRKKTTEIVRDAMRHTGDFRNITPADILENPGIVLTLRMATAPPIAKDRLVGLADTTRSLIDRLEAGKSCLPF